MANIRNTLELGHIQCQKQNWTRLCVKRKGCSEIVNGDKLDLMKCQPLAGG